MNFKRNLVTAALPYANGPLHIGHLAGCYLPADIYVRYLRAAQKDVKFICGSDEHGVPITIRARKERKTPQQIVDTYHKLIQDSLFSMGISFDVYSRTTNKTHEETAQGFFKKLYEAGVFEEKETEQFYDEKEQVFLADRYIIGTCPVCSYPQAFGDQCEKCGTSLSPEQLIAPRSALSQEIPVKKRTTHWYFPLDKYESWLKEWIVEGKKNIWKPNVYGQCKSWLDGGLQPRAMTRDSHWGVPVPLADAEGKVLYVWFDAPIGYISATKELTPLWSNYWMSEDTRLIHFIGKDNIVFHCIIFPAMLKAHGGFVLPDQVPANEFLNIEGEKVSTSRNWAVWVHEYLSDFADQQDALRYVLCANAPETKDNDFTWKDFQARVNNELSGNLGNFFNRAFVMMHKLCNGRVPPLHEGALNETDHGLVRYIQASKKQVEDLLEQFKFREALAEIMSLSAKGNKYLQVNEPWILVKTLDTHPENQQRIDNCIHLSLQLCANIAILINPFLPFTAKKMLHMMKVVERMLQWENAGRIDLLKVNYPLRAPEILFRKIEDEEVQKQIEKLKNNKKTKMTDPQISGNADTQPSPPVLSFDEFSKMDLRVGTILTAEKVPNTDKLVKLEVDLGKEVRTIVSGIALHYQPEKIIGLQVLIVANLAPRKMRGIESQGMILMTENAEGNLIFVAPAEAVAPGNAVR